MSDNDDKLAQKERSENPIFQYLCDPSRDPLDDPFNDPNSDPMLASGRSHIAAEPHESASFGSGNQRSDAEPEPDLDPPYDEQWPSWVLRVRRRRWTALPVLELCALIICLAALLSLSSPDFFPITFPSGEVHSPVPTLR
ncbi:MAG: hypothetical protein AAF672_13895 [Pseudomonadota bacterium]